MKIELVCFQCGKTFERKIGNVNQAKRDGYSRTYCSNECSHKGNSTKIKVSCSQCGKDLLIRKRQHEKSKSKRFFCNHSCSASCNNMGIRRHGDAVEHSCKNCGRTTKNKTWCQKKCHSEFYWNIKVRQIEKSGVIQFGVEGHNRRIAKRYLIVKRGHLCEICKLAEWLDKPIPLVLDHIDGDSRNYLLTNLRIVCGNCNMQLDTFAGRNKGKGTRGKAAHV